MKVTEQKQSNMKSEENIKKKAGYNIKFMSHHNKRYVASKVIYFRKSDYAMYFLILLSIIIILTILIAVLRLYDIVNTPGVTADVSHIDTGAVEIYIEFLDIVELLLLFTKNASGKLSPKDCVNDKSVSFIITGFIGE
ncbi:malate dehydrogenase [Trifolium repens]|nr:malate dehydrogenase [Trifolium repens]